MQLGLHTFFITNTLTKGGSSSNRPEHQLLDVRKGVPDTGDEDWHIQAKADDEIQFTHVSHSDEDTIDKDSKKVTKAYEHIVG